MISYTEKFYFAFVILLISIIMLSVYEDVSMTQKCDDAGGVYVGHSTCVNTSAIIEVD